MSDKEKDKPPIGPTSTTEVALTRMFSAAAQPSVLDQLRALEMTLREMARDPYTNPQRLIPEKQMQREGVKPTGAGEVVTAGETKRGSGWQEEKPLGPVVKPGSMAERVMSDLIDQAFPPGGEKKDRK